MTRQYKNDCDLAQYNPDYVEEEEEDEIM